MGGMNSKGETQFKSKFFGSRPAPDFLFNVKQQDLFHQPFPFPLDTVGEVKYCDLKFQTFISGLGQIIGYLNASKFEKSPKIYGYYIFFNTDLNKIITKNDEKFLEEIWEKENVFTVII